MKFIVSSTALSSHLQAISRVINSKNALPILDCFLFELEDGTLSVTVSDSETTMVTTVEVNESDTNGRFAVVAKTLLDALKEIPEQLADTDRRNIRVKDIPPIGQILRRADDTCGGQGRERQQDMAHPQGAAGHMGGERRLLFLRRDRFGHYPLRGGLRHIRGACPKPCGTCRA